MPAARTAGTPATRIGAMSRPPSSEGRRVPPPSWSAPCGATPARAPVPSSGATAAARRPGRSRGPCRCPEPSWEPASWRGPSPGSTPTRTLWRASNPRTGRTRRAARTAPNQGPAATGPAPAGTESAGRRRRGRIRGRPQRGRRGRVGGRMRWPGRTGPNQGPAATGPAARRDRGPRWSADGAESGAGRNGAGAAGSGASSVADGAESGAGGATGPSAGRPTGLARLRGGRGRIGGRLGGGRGRVRGRPGPARPGREPGRRRAGRIGGRLDGASQGPARRRAGLSQGPRGRGGAGAGWATGGAGRAAGAVGAAGGAGAWDVVADGRVRIHPGRTRLSVSQASPSGWMPRLRSNSSRQRLPSPRWASARVHGLSSGWTMIWSAPIGPPAAGAAEPGGGVKLPPGGSARACHACPSGWARPG